MLPKRKLKINATTVLCLIPAVRPLAIPFGESDRSLILKHQTFTSLNKYFADYPINQVLMYAFAVKINDQ